MDSFEFEISVLLLEIGQEKVHGYADLLESPFFEEMFDHYDLFFPIFLIISYEIYFRVNDVEIHF